MVIFTFLLGTIALFLQTVLFPNFILLAYAPWVAFIILHCPMPKSLYLCCLAGVMIDLLSEDPMGVHALNYTVIALLLFRWRSLFSGEEPLHLAIFTLLVSFSSTLLQLFLLFLFDRRIPFTGQCALGDLILMPVVDAIYALLWFAVPLLFYRKGSFYWRNLKKRLFSLHPP